MSYEYSSESRRLDFPNPFRIENVFWLIGAALLLAGALTLLFMSRAQLAVHAGLWGLQLALGVFMLLQGLYLGGRALAQLRFFFGRGQPAGLAPELQPDEDRTSREADALKETLRQGALSYQEPKGALNGLLYSWIPALIFSPRPVQNLAKRQFQSTVALLVTLLSFLVAWMGAPAGPASAWLSLFYFLFSAFLLLRPLFSRNTTELGLWGLVLLVLAPIFLPLGLAFVSSALPDISWLAMNLQTFAMLLAASAAVVLFFLALLHQTPPAPRTQITWQQASLALNAHPKQLLDELERVMQQNWSEQIPNRRYERITPQVALNRESGEFFSQFLEESQPLPPDDLRRMDFAGAFTLPRYRWLAWLDVLGLALLALAVLALVGFGSMLDPRAFNRDLGGYAIFGVAMLLVASYCFYVGHRLWERFDFISTLYWVEMKGNYQAARVDYGNQWTDRLKTQKQVINVENMTLRVWVAQLESVTFGKNAERFITAMHGVPDQTAWLSQHLSQFAAEQSMIVAPSAQADQAKLQSLAAVNQGVSAPALPAALRNQAQGASATTCPECAQPIEPAALFCSHCGLRLAGQ